MKTHKKLFSTFTFSFILIGLFLATSVFAAEHQLYTLSGFVDMLIEKGIITQDKVQKAREMLSLIEESEKSTPEETVSDVRNGDKLEVTVSQYIQQSSLEYNAFEDVEGLLLMAKNTSDTATTFEAKRGCQVVYRIYSDSDELLYDSATESKCDTNETVTYILGSGETRMFEVTHQRIKYVLQKGVYRFVLEYPGYGEGEKLVTIK